MVMTLSLFQFSSIFGKETKIQSHSVLGYGSKNVHAHVWGSSINHVDILDPLTLCGKNYKIMLIL